MMVLNDFLVLATLFNVGVQAQSQSLEPVINRLVSIPFSTSSLKLTYANILLVPCGEIHRCPVCSSVWSDPLWSDFVCGQLKYGRSVEFTTANTSASNVEEYSHRGFYQATSLDMEPSQSIEDILIYSSNCSTGRVVVIQCSFDECGQNEYGNSALGSIIGGVDAPVGRWPWMATVYYDNRPLQSSICGGSILSAEWVVTAAHCVEDPDLSKYLLFFGTDNLTFSARLMLASAQERRAGEIVIHQNYRYGDVIHDIAMIRLEEPLTLTYYVRPICLPLFTDQPSYLNQDCYIMGFGITDHNPDTDISYKLQQAMVDIVVDSFCSLLYDNIPGMPFRPSTMVCAGGFFGNPGVCSGDSGGPMVCKRNDQWQLRGVTSWGVQNCTAYGVFTEVTAYTEWLSDVIGGLITADSGRQQSLCTRVHFNVWLLLLPSVLIILYLKSF